jgi:hypothetical protein
MFNKKLIIYLIVVFVLLITSGCITGKVIYEPKQKNVKDPVVAGQFYPSDKEELSNLINSFLDNSKKVTDDVKAIVVPHAGYIYSGQIAAESFKQINKDYKKVFIIASNHNGNVDFEGASIPKDITHYKTPLGEVQLSKVSWELLKNDLFKSIPEAHNMHMIEVELPFLQTSIKDFKIIPIILGRLNDKQIDHMANKLLEYDDETLYVFSIDLSHYYPYEEAIKLDSFCLSSLISFDYDNVKKCTTDGNSVLLLLLQIVKKKNLDITLIDYKNSGDTAGNKERVVGYSAIVAHEKTPLNNDEKKILMDLARNTIELYVREGKVLEPDMEIISKYPRLLKNKGVFVSLDKKGMLRGSIGHLLPYQQLYLDVRDNAINAVSNDRRFNPVEPEELDDIEITVSVLDVPVLIEAKDWKDYLDILVPLKDGVIIVYGNRQSTYLPQVWKQLPDKEEFLSRLCMKQGSMPNCWKEPNVKIYKYSADVFYEKEFE